mgnify:CR=1 FL=1
MTVVGVTMTGRYGEEQRLFIKNVRSDIHMKQHAYFNVNNWRNVTPKGGKYIGLISDKKLDTHSFYVKPVVA